MYEIACLAVSGGLFHLPTHGGSFFRAKTGDVQRMRVRQQPRRQWPAGRPELRTPDLNVSSCACAEEGSADRRRVGPYSRARGKVPSRMPALLLEFGSFFYHLFAFLPLCLLPACLASPPTMCSMGAVWCCSQTVVVFFTFFLLLNSLIFGVFYFGLVFRDSAYFPVWHLLWTRCPTWLGGDVRLVNHAFRWGTRFRKGLRGGGLEYAVRVIFIAAAYSVRRNGELGQGSMDQKRAGWRGRRLLNL